MGPFPESDNKMYILVCVDYVTKWVEALACHFNDAKTVIQFLQRNIFCRYLQKGEFLYIIILTNAEALSDIISERWKSNHGYS